MGATGYALAGKSALVTGGGSGLGRAVCRRLAAEGVRVVAFDLDADAMAETADLVRAEGGVVHPVQGDVSVGDDVERVVRRVVDDFASLDLAVNAASVMPDDRPLHLLDETVFERVLRVNAVGTALCLKHELAQMVKQGAGSVVNIGSVQTSTSGPSTPGYAAAKHAVQALTESAALAYGGRGVRVNAVCPGAMDTPMVAARRALSDESDAHYNRRVGGVLGRTADTEEVAEAVVWLLSERSGFVVGHSLVVDGGRLLR